MKLTNERLKPHRSVISDDQFDRIKNYITLWCRIHRYDRCYIRLCEYCAGVRASVGKNMDVVITDDKRVRLDIAVRRKGWLGFTHKHYESIYQEDDGPWWSDFWIDLDKSEEEVLSKLKELSEKYEHRLFSLANEYIHQKYHGQ